MVPAMPTPSQQIRFCTSADGVRIAYATSGSGPPLVKVGTWMTHVELDWESSVWRPWLRELSRDHTFLRYDARGCGLSDREVADISLEAWVRDLETVADAAGIERFPLLGLSQGRRHRDRLRRAPSRAGEPSRAARGVRPRPPAAQPLAAGARGHRGPDQARRDRLGQGRPGVPPVLHHAVHPRLDARAAALVERAAARDDLARERRAVHAGGERDGRHAISRAAWLPDAGDALEVGDRAFRSRKAA